LKDVAQCNGVALNREYRVRKTRRDHLIRDALRTTDAGARCFRSRDLPKRESAPFPRWDTPPRQQTEAAGIVLVVRKPLRAQPQPLIRTTLSGISREPAVDGKKSDVRTTDEASARRSTRQRDRGEDALE
jgi:hypothetical protein